MPSEEQALEFILSLKAPGWDTAVRRVSDGLDKIADAAEDAHQSATKNGKSFIERFLPEKLAQKFSAVKTKAIVGGVNSIYSAFKVLDVLVESSVESWKKNYLAMVDWRKEVGLGNQEVTDFNSMVISTSSRFTMQLDRATTVLRVLQQGSDKAKSSLVNLSGSMAEFEKFTGASAEVSGDLARVLVQQRKALDPEQFERSLYAIRDVMRTVSGSSAELIQILEGNAQIFQTYGRENVQPLIRDISSMAAAILEAGGNMNDVNMITRQLGDRQSYLSKIYMQSSFNLSKALEEIGKMSAQTEENFQSRQTFAETRDMDIRTVNLLADAYENITSKQDTFTDSMSRSSNESRKMEREMATGLERVVFMWQDIENAIVDVTDAGMVGLLPMFNEIVAVSEVITKVAVGWVHDLANGLRSLTDAYKGLKSLVSSPLETAKSVFSGAGMSEFAKSAAGRIGKLTGSGNFVDQMVRSKPGDSSVFGSFAAKQAKSFDMFGLNKVIGNAMSPFFTTESTPGTGLPSRESQIKMSPMQVPAEFLKGDKVDKGSRGIIDELKMLRKDINEAMIQGTHRSFSGTRTSYNTGQQPDPLSFVRFGVG